MRFGLDETTIEKLAKVFESNPKVDKAFIFGSRAKGNFREDSDIDIALKGYDLGWSEVAALSGALEEAGLFYKIDLVAYNGIKEPALVEYIDRVGAEIYSRWKEYNLGEVCSAINYGFTASANPNPIGPKFLRITDIVPGRVDWSGVPYCVIKQADYKKNKLEKGDIVIARTGATTGYNYLFNDDVDAVFASYLIRYRINKKIAHPTFIGYLLKTESWKGFVEGVAGGSAQPGANAKVFAAFEFELPPLEDQVAIASTLNTLDDKIDLLHRQNKTLESLAEALFKQWFVEEAGEDWEEKSLDNYVYFDPREKIDRQKGHQFFDMKCLSNNNLSIDEGVVRKVSSASSFRNGDTLLAKITPCLENGKTGFVVHLDEEEIARGSTEFIVMRSKGMVSPYWIYCLARDEDFRENAIQSMTGTSGRQRVQIDLLKGLPLKMDEGRMSAFHETVHPYFQKIKSNDKQVFLLAKLRDELLPKLMTGDVRVDIS